MGKYETLKPKSLWSIFAEISRIPRGSGNETAVMEMLKAWAAERGLACRQDKVGNLLITVPGTKGREKRKPVLVQGHIDMVCEKNSDTKHDFLKDPIKLLVDGDWVTADGTTLGADNAIGVAMGLALAEEKGLAHPPVELLITVDEERGLTGAAGVQPGFFKSKRMINLDSEEDASLFIGCAGGRDSEFELEGKKSKLKADFVARKVTVRGLLGGHSGLDAIRNRGNAIKLLTRCLLAGRDEVPFRIVSIDGGSMRNAIPREAEAVVAMPKSKAARFKKLVDAHAAWLAAGELKGIDDGCAIKVGTARATHALGAGDTGRILDLLMAIPSSVTAMSQAIEGLVESSTNLGVVKTDGVKVRIVCCSRSSSMPALNGLVRQHLAIGRAAGVKVTQPEGYPGWAPDPSSKIVAATARRYKAIFKREPELKAIHAGLECGLLTEKYPDLDIVSFGPDIHGAHSPDEKVSTASTMRIWKLFTALLADLD